MHHSRLVATAPWAAQARTARQGGRGKILGGGPLDRDSFTSERGRCADCSRCVPPRKPSRLQQQQRRNRGCRWCAYQRKSHARARSQKFAGRTLLDTQFFVPRPPKKGTNCPNDVYEKGGRRRGGPCFSTAATPTSPRAARSAAQSKCLVEVLQRWARKECVCEWARHVCCICSFCVARGGG
jgi:hypothetical protein